MAETDLRAFVREGVRVLGGLADEPDVRTLDLILPDQLREPLGCGQYLRLDLEGHELSVGSPVVEAVAAGLAKGACAARAFLNPIYLQGGDLGKKWDREFRFMAGRAGVVSQALEETIHAVFYFRASYLTDGREERLYRVAVNLSTRAPYDALIDEWSRLSLEEAPAFGDLAGPGKVDFSELRPAIERSLRLRMGPDIEDLRKTQEKFLNRELGRLNRYYRALESEIEERVRWSASEARNAMAANRRRAAALDRERKTRDAVDKHRLRVETEAVALLMIHQPWLRVRMRLESRRESMEKAFFWNPALKAFAPAACDACADAMAAFSLMDSRLLCPSCAGAA